MPAARDTGYHPLDPDWTRGRERALEEAETIVRRQIGLERTVKMIRQQERD